MRIFNVNTIIIKTNKMETLIDFILYAFLASAVFTLFLIGGEYVAMFYPNSAFTKWWRKHIVDQYPYNDDKF